MFNLCNYEVRFRSKDLNHYLQTIYVSEFFLETQNADMTLDTLEFYDEQAKEDAFNKLSEEEQEALKDKAYDREEEANALDIGDDILDEEGRFDLYSNYEFRSNINRMIKNHELPPGTYYY